MEDDDTNVHSLNIRKDADAAASEKLVRQAPTTRQNEKGAV